MASNSLTAPYLVLSGVIVAGIFLGVVMVQPLVNDIQNLRQETVDLRTRLEERQEFLRVLDTKVAALARENQHERQLNVILPTSDENQDVMRLLHQAQTASGGAIRLVSNISAGVQNNLNARRARGEAIALPPGVTPLGFSVEFTGSYQQLRVFLDNLVRSPRLMDIVRLEIRRAEQAIDVVNAMLTIHFYRYQSPS